MLFLILFCLVVCAIEILFVFKAKPRLFLFHLIQRTFGEKGQNGK